VSLLWVRIDTNLASHDKILALVNDPSPRRWQAAFSYVCAIGWAGDRETDGVVSRHALPYVHGTPTTARLLVDYGLWEPNGSGSWHIHNFAERQQTSVVAAQRRLDAARAACIRWHGPECWGPNGCSRSA
jgi:hypothetical protein